MTFIISHYFKLYLGHFLLNCSFWQIKLLSSLSWTSCPVKIQKSNNVFILNSKANEAWSIGSCYALLFSLSPQMAVPLREASSCEIKFFLPTVPKCCSQRIIRFSLSLMISSSQRTLKFFFFYFKFSSISKIYKLLNQTHRSKQQMETLAVVTLKLCQRAFQFTMSTFILESHFADNTHTPLLIYFKLFKC